MEQLKAGTDVILEIDTQGAFQVKSTFPDAILIFILPPSMAELKNRITGRGSETEEAIAVRLGEAMKEMESVIKYDYYVINNIRAEAVAKVKGIISAEHSRVTKDIEKLLSKFKEDM